MASVNKADRRMSSLRISRRSLEDVCSHASHVLVCVWEYMVCEEKGIESSFLGLLRCTFCTIFFRVLCHDLGRQDAKLQFRQKTRPYIMMGTEGWHAFAANAVPSVGAVSLILTRWIAKIEQIHSGTCPFLTLVYAEGELGGYNPLSPNSYLW